MKLTGSLTYTCFSRKKITNVAKPTLPIYSTTAADFLRF